MRKYSIQVFYDDPDAPHRCKSVFWAEAEDIGAAYEQARKAFVGKKVKFGAIIPGHHPNV